MTGKSIHLPQHSPGPGGSHNWPSAVIKQLSLTWEREKRNTPAFWKYDKSVFGCLYSSSSFLFLSFFSSFIDNRLNFRSVTSEFSSDQFSSKQRLAALAAPPCLWEVSPALPLKQFQCTNTWKIQKQLDQKQISIYISLFIVLPLFKCCFVAWKRLTRKIVCRVLP